MAATSPSTTGQTTSEYTTLRKSYRIMVSHFKSQLGDISDALFENGLIPPTVCDYVSTDGIQDEKKAKRLINALMDKVEADPSTYYRFMSVLKNEGPWADTIVEQLEEAFKAEQARADSDRLSEDSHPNPDTSAGDTGSVTKSEPDTVFSKTMTCSELCKWLASCGLSESVTSVIRGQEIDGESFLQLSSLSKEALLKELDCKLTYGAYNKLRRVLEQAVATAKSKESAPGSKFICPFCKKCTVMQFFSSAGCPLANASERVSPFPYFDYSSLTGNERLVLEAKLLDDTKRMVRLFADTELAIISSLESKNVSVSNLKTYAGNFVRMLGSDEDIDRLERSVNMGDVFFALHRFKSFFNYEVVESIVKQFGSDEDRQLMGEYVSQFNKFCERNVFEVPPNIFHDSEPKPGDKMFSVKLTKEGRALLGDVVAMRKKIADILNIEVVALQLCCITDGCICLMFLISAFVAAKIFPLSESQISSLSKINVTIQESPFPVDSEEQSTSGPALVEEGKFENFKAQLAETEKVFISPISSKQKLKEFIDVCKAGEVDQLIDICLSLLGIEGEAATELRAVALEEVYNGDITFISHLVRESGINLDEQDEEGGATALYWACYYGHDIIARVLVECGASLNIQTRDGHTALWTASFEGHQNIVELLTNAGAAVDVQEERGSTALMAACQEGHCSIVERLIEAGASLDVQRNDGHTALWIASYKGHLNIVELLTNAGAAVDVQDEDGTTALFVASQEGHCSIVERLIEAGASLDLQRNDEVVKVLLRAKAGLNLQTNDGRTALYIASWKGHDKVVNILLKAKADLNLQKNDGRTALWIASYEGHLNIVELLTNAGAAVDVQNEDGWTALHAACQEGKEQVVKALVIAKADLNLQANDGQTALYIASWKGHDKVVNILLKAKADLNLQNNDGSTALYRASEEGHSAVVQLLVEAGAFLDVQTNDGWTALCVASLKGHDKTVKILLRAKADLNLQTNGGWTALHAACQEGKEQVVEALVIAKADINLQTNDGQSALFVASLKGHDKIVKILLRAKADLNLQTKIGHTPLDIATQFHGPDSEVVQVLTAAGAKTGKQLSDLADTLPATEESLKPSSSSEHGYQTVDETDVQAPKSIQHSYESIKPSRITLTKLVKITRSLITSKLRASKNIKSDHSNLKESTHSKNVKNVS